MTIPEHLRYEYEERLAICEDNEASPELAEQIAQEQVQARARVTRPLEPFAPLPFPQEEQ